MNNQTKVLFYSLFILSLMIEYTYKVGKASAPYIKSTVAFIYTMALMAGDGVEHLYNNRTEYLTKLNNFRNKVGGYFTLDTPVLV